MNSDHVSTPVRPSRPVRRATKLVAVAGIAAGGAFAAVTGISAAAGSPTKVRPATPGAVSPSTAPNWYRGGSDRPGRGGDGFGFGFGHGDGDGDGDGGTITAIHGTTLTLRTEAGTETVTTTASTTFVEERRRLTLSALRTGEVVEIGRADGPGDPATPVTGTPGTGTVKALQVTVVLPEFSGRVSSISGGVYTLVGADGQLLTVSSSNTTRYYRANATTSAAAVGVGSYVIAEGPQDGITHLRADTVTLVVPHGPWVGGPGRPGPAGFPTGGPAGWGSDASSTAA